jgi:hypothetical protein
LKAASELCAVKARRPWVAARAFFAKEKNSSSESGGFLQLQWSKCAGGEWCRLDKLNLAEIDGFGVFVVWRAGDSGRTPAVLYVGRGALRQQLADCRRDPIMSNGNADVLRITWAAVDPRDVDAVAAYLYQQLRPLWGEVQRLPAAPRPVNLPLTA